MDNLTPWVVTNSAGRLAFQPIRSGQQGQAVTPVQSKDKKRVVTVDEKDANALTRNER